MSKSVAANQISKSGIQQVVFSFLICAASGFALTFGFLLLFSWLMLKFYIAPWTAVPLATFSVCFGCLICGYLFSKRIKKNGLFCGLCSGIFYFGVYLTASLLVGQFTFSALGSIKLVSCVLSGCIGGCIGIVLNQTKPARTIN